MHSKLLRADNPQCQGAIGDRLTLQGAVDYSRDGAIAPWIGPVISGAIITLWILSFIGLSAHRWSSDSVQSLIWIVPAVLGRTFLQTGLFIIGHDAIHGAVFPHHSWLNRAIGTLVVWLYAFLPYNNLFEKHWQHHRHPGRLGDPDYHDGTHTGFLAWYLHFMNNYLDARQKPMLLIGMATLFTTCWWGFHLSPISLLVFWVLPILLSSLQLFYFGTYLPHRCPSEGYTNRHHARSSHYSRFWSFLACYHFDYHWEHHEFPSLAWYQLPTARQKVSV